MDENATIIEKCSSIKDVDAHLQNLTRELLNATQNKGGKFPGIPAENKDIDLDILAQLSFAELQHHKRPVFTLSEICRLFIKKGDMRSFNRISGISNRIFSVKCKKNQSWYISFLYKGIAQIGMGLSDIGVKNVLFGIYKHTGYSLVPVDKALAYKALMSASIHNKNLKMALKFAKDWHNAAMQGDLKLETFQARMALQIFYLLYGQKDKSRKGINVLSDNPPKEWTQAVNYLSQWTMLVSDMTCSELKEFSEPYPLFIGIKWHESLEFHELQSPDNFTNLCKLVRKFCNSESIQALPVNDIENFANIIAGWELSGLLREFEAILKDKDTDIYHNFTMTRLFGKGVIEKMLFNQSVESEIIIQEDSFILVMDVRKYSKISENLSPDKIFNIFNPLFKIMNDELEKIGGIVLEYVGDCIVVVFNTFGDYKADISDILYMTTRCIQNVRVLSALSLHANLPEINIGIGINKGSIGIGYIGGLNRCNITVLGNTINLAARIESETKESPGDILVSKECYDNKEPDIWKNPLKVNYLFRDAGLKKVKNISKPVSLYSASPILHYRIDFVPMGFVTKPEKGVVYIDTGNSNEPGIIDHHTQGHECKSACELLMHKPEMLIGHIHEISYSELEFRLHDLPDFDCASTLYCAFELMDKNPRKSILNNLAKYSSIIDQGHIPDSDQLKDTFFGIFLAHQEIVKQTKENKNLSNFEMLEAGLRVIDAAVFLMEMTKNADDFSLIFQYQPEWFAQERKLIENDEKIYQKDLKSGLTYKAHVNGYNKPVTGLWLDHPKSLFFKHWARTDFRAPGSNGYAFLAVDFSEQEKRRFVISVAPESNTHLQGLGALLEKHESEKRKRLKKERPVEPVRLPSDNADPWYFGWAHEYTIIDSPREGTILSGEEVRDIHKGWVC